MDVNRLQRRFGLFPILERVAASRCQAQLLQVVEEMPHEMPHEMMASYAHSNTARTQKQKLAWHTYEPFVLRNFFFLITHVCAACGDVDVNRLPRRFGLLPYLERVAALRCQAQLSQVVESQDPRFLKLCDLAGLTDAHCQLQKSNYHMVRERDHWTGYTRKIALLCSRPGNKSRVQWSLQASIAEGTHRRSYASLRH